MKSHLLFIAIALFASAAIAAADEPQSSLKTVTVHPGTSAAKTAVHGYTLDCTPPNTAVECAAFHREIRRNFSDREIGMLFGASTAYPESRSAYPQVAARYDAFSRTYDQQHLTAFALK
jgi:hypothetical protein